MKYSCADYTFPLLERKRLLQLLRLLDIPAVDIGLFARSTQYRPEDLMRHPAQFTKDVRRELDDAGIRPVDVFLQIGAEPSHCAANDPGFRHRDVFDAAVEFAAAIGCHHLTGLPGVPQFSFQAAVDEALNRVETASRAGVVYAIEPHVGSICQTPRETLRLLEAVPGLTLTLDYGHFLYQGFGNDEVHPLADHASHVHLRAGCKGQLQARVAENAIDFAGLLHRLHARHYSGYYCLEYVWVDWEGCNRTDNLSETLLLREQLTALSRGHASVAGAGDPAGGECLA